MCGRSTSGELMSERRPDHSPDHRDEQIIEVGGEQPEIVDPTAERPSRGFGGMNVGSGRIFVARGSGRSCLIPLGMLALLLLCVCVLGWMMFDAVF